MGIELDLDDRLAGFFDRLVELDGGAVHLYAGSFELLVDVDAGD